MKKIGVSICTAFIIYLFNAYLSGSKHHTEMEAVMIDTGRSNHTNADTVVRHGASLTGDAPKNFMEKKIGYLLTNIDSLVKEGF